MVDFGRELAALRKRGTALRVTHSPPAILTTCAVLACACSGLDLAQAPFLLVEERPRQFPSTRPNQWRGARECLMAMLVDHGYSVADVARMLDCSARRVRRAYASFRESPEDASGEIVVH